MALVTFMPLPVKGSTSEVLPVTYNPYRLAEALGFEANQIMEAYFSPDESWVELFVVRDGKRIMTEQGPARFRVYLTRELENE